MKPAAPAFPGLPEDEELFAWTFPGAPVAIYLPIDLIFRIGQVTQARKETGSERGGILLGRSLSAGTVEILACHPVEAEGTDLREAIAEARRRQAGDPQFVEGPPVVGYYRTHRADRLFLDEHDRRLIEAEFGGRDNVFLLVKPDAGEPTAGFFFWDGDRIESDLCYLGFPLDPVVLPVESRAAEENGGPGWRPRWWRGIKRT